MPILDSRPALPWSTHGNTTNTRAPQALLPSTLRNDTLRQTYS